jgi:hypothetical protein
MRKAGHVMGELRRMSNGFQAELRDAMREPVDAAQESIDLARGPADGMARATPPRRAEVYDPATPDEEPDGHAPDEAPAPDAAAAGPAAEPAAADPAAPAAGTAPPGDAPVVDPAAGHSLEALMAAGLGVVPDPSAPVEPDGRVTPEPADAPPVDGSAA